METAETVTAAFDLRGRTAVVTGAGGGIGRACAQVLAGAGATVWCVDLIEDAAAETAAGIVGTGGLAEFRILDVTASEELEGFVDDLPGTLDVWCNVAGIMVDGAILDLAEADVDHIFAVNVKGVLFGCQAAGRKMVAQRSGSIINMASAAALSPAPAIGAYAITKAAVVQLTRTFAMEVGRRGVRVNTVAPGFVPTNMTSRYYRNPNGEIDEDLKAQVLAPMAKFAPLGRVGDPVDIAYCVLYLASDASSFVTGQCLSPNGGVAMH